MSEADTAAHLAALEHPQKDALEELCRVVREADPRVQEEIKWIFPSFFVTDHFATTSLPPRGPLRLVLHTGAKKQAVAAAVSIDDEGGLLEWKGSDRAVLTFRGIEQVRERRRAVQDLIRQ